MDLPLVWQDSSLNTCLGKEFNVLKQKINFKTGSNDGDDYWPDDLTITMENDEKYEKKGMSGWVDNYKNNHFRIALKTSVSDTRN